MTELASLPAISYGRAQPPSPADVEDPRQPLPAPGGPTLDGEAPTPSTKVRLSRSFAFALDFTTERFAAPESVSVSISFSSTRTVADGDGGRTVTRSGTLDFTRNADGVALSATGERVVTTLGQDGDRTLSSARSLDYAQRGDAVALDVQQSRTVTSTAPDGERTAERSASLAFTQQDGTVTLEASREATVTTTGDEGGRTATGSERIAYERDGEASRLDRTRERAVEVRIPERTERLSRTISSSRVVADGVETVEMDTRLALGREGPEGTRDIVRERTLRAVYEAGPGAPEPVAGPSPGPGAGPEAGTSAPAPGTQGGPTQDAPATAEPPGPANGPEAAGPPDTDPDGVPETATASPPDAPKASEGTPPAPSAPGPGPSRTPIGGVDRTFSGEVRFDRDGDRSADLRVRASGAFERADGPARGAEARDRFRSSETRFELDLTTRDGDRLTIAFESYEQARRAGGVREGDFARTLELSVDGALDARETRQIEMLIGRVIGAGDQALRGRGDALARLADLGAGASEIASFALEYERTETRAVSAYREQGADPAPRGAFRGAIDGAVREALREVAGSARSLIEDAGRLFPPRDAQALVTTLLDASLRPVDRTAPPGIADGTAVQA